MAAGDLTCTIVAVVVAIALGVCKTSKTMTVTIVCEDESVPMEVKATGCQYFWSVLEGTAQPMPRLYKPMPRLYKLQVTHRTMRRRGERRCGPIEPIRGRHVLVVRMQTTGWLDKQLHSRLFGLNVTIAVKWESAQSNREPESRSAR